MKKKDKKTAPVSKPNKFVSKGQDFELFDIKPKQKAKNTKSNN